MGSFFSSPKKPVKILVAGLDAAGKTTMLYKLKAEDIKDTIPTIGMIVETARYKNLEVTSWDSGGRMKIGPLKRHFLQDTAGVIYLVDANDRERIEESADELKKELANVEYGKRADEQVPLLVLANKMDLPNAMSAAEVTDKMGLHLMNNRAWYLQACCATSGDGLHEGLDWFTKQLEQGGYKVKAACDIVANKA